MPPTRSGGSSSPGVPYGRLTASPLSVRPGRPLRPRRSRTWVHTRWVRRTIVELYLGRGARVIATVRDPATAPLADLRRTAGDRLRVERLDVTDADSIHAVHDLLVERARRHPLDLLFVNAGVTNGPDETPADVTTAEFTRLMVTNALGPMRVIEALGDLVAADGTIGAMSSGQGSIADNERGGFEIYRASKSALNQLMRSYAARHRRDRRALVLMAPGWGCGPLRERSLVGQERFG